MVTELNVNNFEDKVLRSDKTVLVDFWASWCGPCRMLSPIIDEVADETPSISVCKINVDEQPALASQFKVMTIPTVLVFRNGAVVAKSVGYKPKSAILDLIK